MALPQQPHGRHLWRNPLWLRLISLAGACCYFAIPVTILGSCEMTKSRQFSPAQAGSLAFWICAAEGGLGIVLLQISSRLAKRLGKAAEDHSDGVGPDDETIKNGARYCFRIERNTDSRCGEIWCAQGIIRWRYSARECLTTNSLQNPFGKLEFLVRDSDGKEVMCIRRASFIPSQFVIVDGGIVVGRIGLRSILRNSYKIQLTPGLRWRFRMPLFTVRFGGDSSSGTHVWVLVGPSKMEWNILMKSGTDDPRLLFALAFIHNEWWNYS